MTMACLCLLKPEKSCRLLQLCATCEASWRVAMRAHRDVSHSRRTYIIQMIPCPSRYEVKSTVSKDHSNSFTISCVFDLLMFFDWYSTVPLQSDRLSDPPPERSTPLKWTPWKAPGTAWWSPVTSTSSISKKNRWWHLESSALSGKPRWLSGSSPCYFSASLGIALKKI